MYVLRKYDSCMYVCMYVLATAKLQLTNCCIHCASLSACFEANSWARSGSSSSLKHIPKYNKQSPRYQKRKKNRTLKEFHILHIYMSSSILYHTHTVHSISDRKLHNYIMYSTYIHTYIHTYIYTRIFPTIVHMYNHTYNIYYNFTITL